jgi:hypothetical protein
LRFDDPTAQQGLNTGLGLPPFVDMGAYERLQASAGAPGSAFGGGSGGGGGFIDAVIAERYTAASVDNLDHSALLRTDGRDDETSIIDSLLGSQKELSRKELRKLARANR